MAKQKKQIKTLENLNDYIQVTRKNVKMALGMYDHYYYIQKKGKKWELFGHGDVCPRWKHKGWHRIDNWPVHGCLDVKSVEFFVFEEEDQERYYSRMWAILFHDIDRGVVYVHKTKKEKSKYSIIKNRTI